MHYYQRGQTRDGATTTVNAHRAGDGDGVRPPRGGTARHPAARGASPLRSRRADRKRNASSVSSRSRFSLIRCRTRYVLGDVSYTFDVYFSWSVRGAVSCMLRTVFVVFGCGKNMFYNMKNLEKSQKTGDCSADMLARRVDAQPLRETHLARDRSRLVIFREAREPRRAGARSDAIPSGPFQTSRLTWMTA